MSVAVLLDDLAVGTLDNELDLMLLGDFSSGLEGLVLGGEALEWVVLAFSADVPVLAVDVVDIQMFLWLRQFARTMASNFDTTAALHDLSEDLVVVLGASAAGVALLDGDDLRFVTATNDMAAEAEHLQAFDSKPAGSTSSSATGSCTARR